MSERIPNESYFAFEDVSHRRFYCEYPKDKDTPRKDKKRVHSCGEVATNALSFNEGTSERQRNNYLTRKKEDRTFPFYACDKHTYVLITGKL